MPKARQVLAGLQRDGWVIVRSRGSHRTLRKGDQQTTWAWHDGVDLGTATYDKSAASSGTPWTICATSD